MPKQHTAYLAAIGINAVVCAAAQAGIIFQQDFNNISTTADFVNASSPSSSQVNELSASAGSDTGWAISGDDLVLTVNTTTASSQVVGFTRSTDFSGPPTLISAKMVVTADSQGNFASDAAKLTFGNLGTTYYGGAAGSTAGKFGELGVALRGTSGGIDKWSLRSGSSNAAASVNAGVYVTGYIFLNNTASTQNYTGPDNLSHPLAAGTFTVWQDSVVVGNESTAKLGASSDLSNFRLRFTPPGTQGVQVSVDELVIRDDLNVVVPEPALLPAAAVGILGLRRRRVQR